MGRRSGLSYGSPGQGDKDVNRKQRRQAARAQRRAGKAGGAGAEAGENAASGGAPAQPTEQDAQNPGHRHLTRKQLAFAIAWAESEPSEPLYEIAARAGYSESVAAGGKIAELCRHPEVVKVRDRRLAELRAVSGVTPEDALITLQRIASEPGTPAKDRVAASRAILAWYASNKGQQEAPARGKVPGGGGGLSREAVREFEVALLGVDLEEETPG